MEGIGSRFGRVSSRYGSISGPGPSPPVFKGPVRKWERRWVRSQPNYDYAVTGKANHQENKPTLLLCRWTPLSSTNNSADPPEPAKRKFRYTPVVVLEEKKKEGVEKMDGEGEARKMKQSRPLNIRDDMLIEKPSIMDEDDDDDDDDDDDFMEEIEESTDDQAYFENLDLQL